MYEQASIFDDIPYYKIPKGKVIRMIELFAGVGAQSKALERLGVPFEHYRVCEFDKYAVRSYNAIHGTNFETSDIRDIHAEDLGIVETDKYEYIMTYSFPCTDLSVAGKMQGMSRDSGTRSGLLWEVERLLKECTNLPQILLLENVPQICGSKNERDFNEWLIFLEKLGYSNFYEIMNAKDYGVPQNQERCFMVSILGNWRYKFPKPIKLEKRLKDLLEDKVDEKYYLSDAYLKYAEDLTVKMKAENKGFVFDPTWGGGTAKAVTGNAGNRVTDNFVYSPLNAEADGTCRTIKAQYQQSSYANFVRQGTYGATGVIKID